MIYSSKSILKTWPKQLISRGWEGAENGLKKRKMTPANIVIPHQRNQQMYAEKVTQKNFLNCASVWLNFQAPNMKTREAINTMFCSKHIVSCD